MGELQLQKRCGGLPLIFVALLQSLYVPNHGRARPQACDVLCVPNLACLGSTSCEFVVFLVALWVRAIC